MTKDEALARVRIAAAELAIVKRRVPLLPYGVRNSEWRAANRKLITAEMDAIMAGASAAEVNQARE